MSGASTRSRKVGSMTDVQPASRRRGSVLEQAIFKATIEELKDVGYANLKIEQVALRAGAGKASLYKRWPTRASLVRAAIMEVVSTNFDEESLTGETFDDLRTMLLFVAGIFGSPMGEYARGLIGESSPGDPADTEFVAWMAEMRDRSVVRILENGIAKGEVRPESLDPLISGLGFDMIISRYLMTGITPDEATIDDIMERGVIPLLRSQRA
jgi:AcrR family transcriptional regulator